MVPTPFSPADSGDRLRSVEEARSAILDRVRSLAPRRSSLADALGLVLAEDVAADLDLPPFDKSLVDGFAVRSADFAGEGPYRLDLGEEILAGQMPSRPLNPNEAAEIMTGAPLPLGADAAVMVERARRVDREILFESAPKSGQNILNQGREMRLGEVVLAKGRWLSAAEIGLLASVGCVEPMVIPRPKVAVIPTGDELVEPDRRPGPGQIRNSNGAMLASLARDAGADAELFPIAADEAEMLREALNRGLQEADVLLITGGVSAGRRDLVPSTLEELGVEKVFHKVSVRPGKPLWFGVGPDRGKNARTLVFGLPGNPGSGIVGFELFVRPALEALAGWMGSKPREIAGKLTASFDHRGDRPTYQPAILREDGSIETLDWAGSADLRTIARADGWACFPGGDRVYQAGEMIPFLPSRAGTR